MYINLDMIMLMDYFRIDTLIEINGLYIYLHKNS